MTAKPRDGVLRGGPALSIRLLLLAAVGISAYLLSVSLSGGTAVGCGPGSSCDTVLKSRWGYFFGVPVSLLAVLVDSALLFTTFSCSPRSKPVQRRKAWEIIVAAALLILGSVLWFVAIQAVVLQKFCPWCMTAHACGSVAAILLLLRAPIRQGSERQDKDPAVPQRTMTRLAALAMVLVAVLAAAQIAVAPKTYAVKSVTASLPEASPTNSAATNAGPVAAPVPRTFGVYGGAVNLDLAEVPIWGSPGAPFKVVSLHDYSCKHCAEMHSRIAEVQRAFSNRVAVLSLPMPLDGKCNPVIQRTPRDHTNACAYARIGLAVWKVRREALAGYEDWFFETFHQAHAPPTLEEATNRAAQAVGGLPALQMAMSDPFVDRQLKADIEIFRISTTQFRNGSMPQFIIGSNLVSGIVPTTQLSNLVSQMVGNQ